MIKASKDPSNERKACHDGRLDEMKTSRKKKIERVIKHSTGHMSI
jgi:hypothetical protein